MDSPVSPLSHQHSPVFKSTAVEQVRVCQAAGPGSIPGRDKFPGWRFFGVFSSPVRQMSESFRPPRSPNIIWPSLPSILIHYGRQWPEMLTRPKISTQIKKSSFQSLHFKTFIFSFTHFIFFDFFNFFPSFISFTVRKNYWFGVPPMYNHTGWGESGARTMCSSIGLSALPNIV